MSEKNKRMGLTRMVRNAGERRQDHVAMGGAFCLLVLHALCLSCASLASSFLLQGLLAKKLFLFLSLPALRRPCPTMSLEGFEAFNKDKNH